MWWWHLWAASFELSRLSVGVGGWVGWGGAALDAAATQTVIVFAPSSLGLSQLGGLAEHGREPRDTG